MANGYNTCLFMMQKGKIKLLILAADVAPGSLEKMQRAAAACGIPCIVYGTKESLSHATGREDSGIFGVTDENLAKAISEETIRQGS